MMSVFNFNTISTHALTEGDCLTHWQVCVNIISTHALTEGDFRYYVDLIARWYFNSRPHGGRQVWNDGEKRATNISTHALTEGDKIRRPSIADGNVFQLTPSRRATANLDKFFF